MTLELLGAVKPTVIVYRIGKLDMHVCNFFKKSRFITLVNMLADKELYPEYLTDHCVADNISGHILGWLNDAAAYRDRCQELAELRQQVARPGACAKTARFIIDKLAQPQKAERRAA